MVEYCSKVHHNSSHVHLSAEACNYNNWEPEAFANSTLLKLCGGREGLRDHICQNASLYLQLVPTHHWLLDYCTDPGAVPEDGKCVLQQVFDMLPAPYDFDTSQLCVNPAPFLMEALYRLSQCGGAVDERVGWLGAVSYVLRVLDFVVGLSAGLEEGESEVRQGLGQAILLSSLLDNSSFWATLRPNASLSVLQTVAVFLKKEQNPSLKEDLLSCFSVGVCFLRVATRFHHLLNPANVTSYSFIHHPCLCQIVLGVFLAPHLKKYTKALVKV